QQLPADVLLCLAVIITIIGSWFCRSDQSSSNLAIFLGRLCSQFLNCINAIRLKVRFQRRKISGRQLVAQRWLIRFVLRFFHFFHPRYFNMSTSAFFFSLSASSPWIRPSYTNCRSRGKSIS